MRIASGFRQKRTSTLSETGGVMTGPLILHADPVVPLHAATKQYVDNLVNNLNANNILSGTLRVESLPGFNGEASANSGSNQITLPNIGVTPGDYTKVIVDAKGRVTGSDILNPSDISAVNYESIINNPTTLAGYGITDGLSTNGDTLTTEFTVDNPTNSYAAANKQYSDTVLSNNSISYGDIIRKCYLDDSDMFKLCNGIYLDKDEYSEVYNVIGDSFADQAIAGGGQPWVCQYGFNSEQYQDITGWATTTALPESFYLSSTVVTKNKVYVFGGLSSPGASYVYSDKIYQANVNEDGSLGSWSQIGTLPSGRCHCTAICRAGVIYIIGGIDGTNVLSDCLIYDIGSDGTLSYAGNSLMPIAIRSAVVIATSSRIYVIGGSSTRLVSNPVNTVYSCAVTQNRRPFAWQTETALPTALSRTNFTVIKNFVYLMGGSTEATTYTNNIYRASINSAGYLSNFELCGTLPVALYRASVIATNNKLYLIGGAIAGAYSTAVYLTDIRADGSLGTWTTGTALPGIVANGVCFIVKNTLYIGGGVTTGDSYVTTMYKAYFRSSVSDYTIFNGQEYYPFYSYMLSPNGNDLNNYPEGAGQPWKQQYRFNTEQNTSLTTWSTGNALPDCYTKGTIVVTDKKVYIIGGVNSLNTTVTNSVISATINSDGSLGLWNYEISLPEARMLTGSLIIKNKIYIFGGSNVDGSILYNSVYCGELDTNGTIISWKLTNTLSISASRISAVLAHNGVLLIGGVIGASTYTSNVYWAFINEDGTLGSFTAQPSLPVACCTYDIAVTKNQIYTIGVITASGPQTTVYVTSINNVSGISAWTTGLSLPATMYHSKCFVTHDKIYLFVSSTNGTSAVNTLYEGFLDENGKLSAWVAGPNLPFSSYNGYLFAVKNRLYYAGGQNGATILNTVYNTPIVGNNKPYSEMSYDADINYLLPGAGKPWSQQYQINETQSTDIVGWSSAGAIGQATSMASIVVTKNRVYMIGGKNTNIGVTDVYTAVIDTAGNLSNWVISTPLPVGLYGAAVCVVKNKLYVIGGHTGSTAVNTVYFSDIGSDGILGPWMTTLPLPDVIYGHQAIVTKNRLIIFGGQNTSGTPNTSKYEIFYSSAGFIENAWTSGSDYAETGITGSSIALTDNYIYLIGGVISGVYQNTIKLARINSRGMLDKFTTIGTLPINIAYATIYVTKNTIYLIGGKNETGDLSSVYMSTLDATGQPGAWIVGSSIPSAMSGHNLITVNNSIYLLGGEIANVPQNFIYRAVISHDISDYSPYYDGTIYAYEYSDIDRLFKLPDLSHINQDDVNYYIKVK